jgi:hypothetical protein
MNKQISFSLLIVGISLVLIQSCKKLERIDPSCPTITSLSLSAAKYDDIVTITGTNFLPGLPRRHNISIGDSIVPADKIMDVPNTTTMRFRVPKGIGSGPLKVTLLGLSNCTSQGLNFVYRYTVKSSGIINPFAGQTNDRLCPKCFSSPQGLEVDANSNVIVADMEHHVIKKIDTLLRDPIIIAGRNNMPGYEDNAQTAAKFRSPSDVAISDGGDIYVADKGNFCIRIIKGGRVDVYSGNPLVNPPVFNNGTLLAARYEEPTRIATNGKDIIIVTEPGKSRLRLINTVTTQVTTFGSNAPLITPFGVTYSDKRSAIRNDVFKIFLADLGINGSIEGFDLVGNLTTITSPVNCKPYDIAFDGVGNLFILDKVGKKVYIVYTDNSSEIIAENGTLGALFNSPSAIAIDRVSKLLYVSDDFTQTIVRIKFE